MVVLVQVNPLNPYAFVGRVVGLSAWVDAFVEVQVDVVNEAVDVMNNLAAAQNSLAATVTVLAFRLNDMVAAPAYPHCGVDAHKQDYSWDGQLAFQRMKDSLEPHDPVA